jgi:secreted PhoX family phosphatase
MFSKKRLALAVSAALMSLSLSAHAGSIMFEGIEAPTEDADKRKVLASEKVWVDSTQYDIGFNTILRSGQGFEKGSQLPFGTLIDKSGQPLLAEDGELRISNDNDFSSLLDTDHGLFMISHFEARPGAMYITGLKQTDDGELVARWTKPIDFSAVEGGWVHCAGSVTPWNTHLGSEEYEPDVSLLDENGDIIVYPGDTYYNAMKDYVGGDLLALNPYNYGWPIEVEVTSDKGDTQVTKHFAMGRIALELAYVMPDRKTAYMTDDGTNTGLFMFVADKAGDLSSGTLYGARIIQSEPDGSPVETTPFGIQWINLGHADSSTIASAIDAKIQFEDMLEKADPVSPGVCPETFTSINAGHNDGNHQCLKVKPGMDTLASRLETRRYGAMQGVTTEFRKMEGLSFDPDAGLVYMAISEAARGMEDYSKNGSPSDKYDIGGPNDIRVAYNTCGGVYAMNTQKRVRDNNGNRIRSKYVVVDMIPEIFGTMVDGDEKNTCHLDGLANPDNVSFLPGYDTLVIGEDTGSGHQNDIVWSYNTANKELTRIQTTPYGSETTSPYWYPNINGYGYLMSVIQHPYGESDGEMYNEGSSTDRAYTGYIGPFPAMGSDHVPGHGWKHGRHKHD